MKLYATTTSERASKGQGGNHFLHITLNYELKGIRFHYGMLSLNEAGALSFMYPNGEVKNITNIIDLVGNGLITTTTKGEQQKGD